MNRRQREFWMMERGPTRAAAIFRAAAFGALSFVLVFGDAITNWLVRVLS